MRGEEEILRDVGSRHGIEIILVIQDSGEKQPEAGGGGGGRTGQRGRNK